MSLAEQAQRFFGWDDEQRNAVQLDALASGLTLDEYIETVFCHPGGVVDQIHEQTGIKLDRLPAASLLRHAEALKNATDTAALILAQMDLVREAHQFAKQDS